MTQQQKKKQRKTNGLKCFSTTKEANKMRKQFVEWEKMFANHTSGESLISPTYKALIEFYSTKQKNLILE